MPQVETVSVAEGLMLKKTLAILLYIGTCMVTTLLFCISGSALWEWIYRRLNGISPDQELWAGDGLLWIADTLALVPETILGIAVGVWIVRRLLRLGRRRKLMLMREHHRLRDTSSGSDVWPPRPSRRYNEPPT